MAENINNSEVLRYGISALDLSHKNFAENDELMIDSKSGKIYYKRPDGYIISADDNDYSPHELLDEIKKINQQNPLSMDLKHLFNCHLKYFTINLSGVNIKTTTSYTPFTSFSDNFKMHCRLNRIYFRIRGSNEVNKIMSIIESNNNYNGRCRVYGKIEYNTKNSSNAIIQTGVQSSESVRFNKLSKLDFNVDISDASAQINNFFLFNVEGIGCAINNDYNALNTNGILDEINNNNSTLEPTFLDIIIITNDNCDNAYINGQDNRCTLKYSLKVNDILNIFDKDSVSFNVFYGSNKPRENKCIWIDTSNE